MNNNYIVIVDEKTDAHFVADELAKKGTEIRNVFPVVKAILVTTSDPEQIKKVAGVMVVEEEMEFQIPPPENAVQ